ncbi:hypothetical protein YpsIP31758_4014 [Yersinia pseudotuberculosis IP 31758]|uniref:Uncharacterized protein n=1 Tax=Yersinia pseudotuberculosis serotype O:1b (strain IP 31758) TaxID=349747 RepID=A0A0U1QZ28_YERP3|nr:hypothetical protein YpsIP31758_4014 [Yersinia pseudotuberculosis IP 31758]
MEGDTDLWIPVLYNCARLPNVSGGLRQGCKRTNPNTLTQFSDLGM